MTLGACPWGRNRLWKSTPGIAVLLQATVTDPGGQAGFRCIWWIRLGWIAER